MMGPLDASRSASSPPFVYLNSIAEEASSQLGGGQPRDDVTGGQHPAGRLGLRGRGGLRPHADHGGQERR